MKFSDLVKGTIKVGGTIAKVGVELGADVVGAIAEKIDDKPEEKEKIVSSGKELGQKIKKATHEIAEDSVEVVDDIVESGKEAFEDISDKIKKKTGRYTEKESTDSGSSQSQGEDYTSDDIYSKEHTVDESTSEEQAQGSVKKEKINGRTYITINSASEKTSEDINE